MQIFTDQNGVPLSNGDRVLCRYLPENPNQIPVEWQRDFEAWALIEKWDFDGNWLLVLYIIDEGGNLRSTPIYYEYDGEPCYGLEKL